MRQVFVSHTKRDREFCDAFDTVCARVRIRAFRSEFERIPLPPWKKIKRAIDNSIALFFLVGRELVRSQDLSDPIWRYTQNWIAYEIGLACERRIDVWAICDDVWINFPMPYINNYLTVSLKRKDAFDYLRSVLEAYQKGQTFRFPYVNALGEKFGVRCENCKIGFNLHVKLSPGGKIKCPQCLSDLMFCQEHPFR